MNNFLKIYSPILYHNIPIQDVTYNDIVFAKSLAEKFSTMSFQSVFIIDYCLRNFLYITPNSFFLCGEPLDKVKQEGIMFFIAHMPKDEIKQCLEIHIKAKEYFHKLPNNERSESILSVNFHLIQNKHKFLVNAKISPLSLNKNGEVVLGLCLLSLSPFAESGNVEILEHAKNIIKKYDFNAHCWIDRPMFEFSLDDIQLLHCISRGLSNYEIAETFNISVSAVKHRRQVLADKYENNNLQELAALSLLYNLL